MIKRIFRAAAVAAALVAWVLPLGSASGASSFRNVYRVVSVAADLKLSEPDSQARECIDVGDPPCPGPTIGFSANYRGKPAVRDATNVGDLDSGGGADAGRVIANFDTSVRYDGETSDRQACSQNVRRRIQLIPNFTVQGGHVSARWQLNPETLAVGQRQQAWSNQDVSSGCLASLNGPLGHEPISTYPLKLFKKKTLTLSARGTVGYGDAGETMTYAFTLKLKRLRT
jgi:hypothetical protein